MKSRNRCLVAAVPIAGLASPVTAAEDDWARVGEALGKVGGVNLAKS
jgi:hypothetical protein